MQTLAPYFYLYLVALGLFAGLWLLSIVAKDASLVDRFWGLGFCLVFTIALWDARFLTFRAGILFVLVWAWGLRLSWYIHWRNRGHGEDPRYVKMRAQHGPRFWWYSLFSVFLLQGSIQWLIAAPLVAICLFPQSDTFSVFDGIGILLWSVGFVFETVSDYQMARFKKRPENRGKVCRSGLWGWSRHPNYFGETLIWWGFWSLSLTTHWGFLTVFSPALITYLLLRVSGVTLLESQLRERREGYTKYIAEVPAFFPGRRLHKKRPS